MEVTGPIEFDALDLRSAFAGEAAVCADAALLVKHACESKGAFMIEGADLYGLSDDFLRRCDSALEAFFALPTEEKNKWKATKSKDPRGYSGYEEENVYALTQKVGPPDPVEKLSFGVDDNVYPSEPQALEGLLQEYFYNVTRLSGAIFRLLAAALGLPEDIFERHLTHQRSSMRCLHYPPLQAPKTNQHRMAPHTDIGVFTIVRSDDRPGSLEYSLDGDSAFQGYRHRPGSFIVQIGDTLQSWTSQMWKSNRHRVGLPPPDPSGTSRFSIVYFQMVNFDSLIEPFEVYREVGEPTEPFMYGDYLEAKMGRMNTKV
jgi:isopenicillin N synthase-like dioxygenase